MNFFILDIAVAETTKNFLDFFPLSSVVFEPLILRRPNSYFKEGCFPAFPCGELCVRQQCCEQKWCVQLIRRHSSVLPFLLASSTCCTDHSGSEKFREGKISHKKWLFRYQWWSPFSPWKGNKIILLLNYDVITIRFIKIRCYFFLCIWMMCLYECLYNPCVQMPIEASVLRVTCG